MSYKMHRILNAVLAFIYLPLSLIGFLMGMITEGTIGETNRLIIACYYSIAWAGMLTPLTAYGGLLLSHRLFEKGHTTASLFARFLPLIVMATVLAQASLLEWLARNFG